MNSDAIQKEICEIVGNAFLGKEPHSVDVDKPLTGSQIKLNGSELYWLLIAVEEKYNVYFSVDEIMNGNFRTVSEIAKEVIKKKEDFDTGG